MREIKFRGRHTTTNKVIYGYAFKYPGQTSWYILDEHAEQWRMKKNSLAQLIAVDTNGEEVYEGDIVTDKNGRELTASLVAAGTDSKGFHFKWDKDFELKEKK